MNELSKSGYEKIFVFKDGDLFWMSGRFKGKRAGYTDRGYRRVTVNGEGHYVHRIIMIMNGHLISGLEVDHIDGDRMNNNSSNLRVVSKRENALNQKIPKNNNSGVIGVCWCKNMKKWMASIGGMRSELFDSFTEAAKRRSEMEVELNYHKNHGKR